VLATAFGRRQPGRGVILTIAHELAHLYAAETNVKDTDPGGEVHNATFARLAELTGCQVVKASGGYMTPDLSKRGLDLFADLIPQMQQAFVRHATTISSPQANPPRPKSDPRRGIELAVLSVKSPAVPGSSLTTKPANPVVTTEQVQIRGLLAALEDDIRYRLTARAVENVALLSAQGARYLAVAPGAKLSIQALIDNYAANAAAAIRRIGS
jgi:hypothetical protein